MLHPDFCRDANLFRAGARSFTARPDSRHHGAGSHASAIRLTTDLPRRKWTRSSYGWRADGAGMSEVSECQMSGLTGLASEWSPVGQLPPAL